MHDRATPRAMTSLRKRGELVTRGGLVSFVDDTKHDVVTALYWDLRKTVREYVMNMCWH